MLLEASSASQVGLVNPVHSRHGGFCEQRVSYPFGPSRVPAMTITFP